TLATKDGEFDQSFILSYDAAITARLALNLIPDTSQITRIAADADQNNEVQMFDASLIAQYAVGLANSHSKIGDWAFAPENRHYVNLDSSYLYQDFNGTIVGDVDGNWQPGGYLPKSNVPKIYSYLQDQEKEVGDKVRIPFISEGDREILSFDINVSYDYKALRFIGFEQTDLSQKFQIFLNDTEPGKVIIGGFGVEPIVDSGEYLELVFEVIGNNNSSTQVELNSYRINAEDPQQGFATVVITSGQFRELPKEYALLNNFPNPFNPETSIKFQLPQQDHVVIKIFNMMGQEVRVLLDEDKAPGAYQIKWDGRDNWGNVAPSGNYVYRMKTKHFQDSRRMVFLK
ncbi:MAG: T9SS type A sorting domain-containing protein, partial [Calditrichaeota bacterium]|nr:T9SS type A sorting domain-containing protein [Calditrichota bacterium]